MAGVPGFEERQGGSVADLADDDSIGTQTHRTLEQPRHIDRVTGMEEDGVVGRALDFSGILKDDEPIFRGALHDLIDDSIAEQIGPAGATTIMMNKDKSEFATALEAALKGWGYAVITDGKVGKDVKPVELAYSIDGADGQVLARLSTPSVALGRAYAATTAGAVPASPLSNMQRN